MDKKEKITLTTKKEEYCLNCHYPVPTHATYCENCGQKHTNGKSSVWDLFKEFLGTYFNLDSKLFITPVHLFVPGKLTIEYFKGRHKRYYHPIRLLLFLFVTFAALFLWKQKENIKTWNSKQMIESYGEYKVKTKMDSFALNIKKIYPSSQAKKAVDSLQKLVTASLDAANMKDINNNTLSLNIEQVGFGIEIPFRELVAYTPEEIVNKYSRGHTVEDFALYQSAKAIQNGDSLGVYLVGQVLWSIIFTLPFFALILKLLYVRKSRYYVEHLVFGIHFYAFIFFLGIGSLLLTDMTIIGPISILWILGYLYFSMKRIYGQGWFKTFFKYLFLLFSYIIVCTFVMILTLIVSMLFF